MPIVEISTRFEASPDQVWEALQKPRLLQFVARPILHFTPIDPPQFPERWTPRDYTVRMWFLGVLPVGRQIIGLSHPPAEGDERLIRDNGRSAIIKRWDHLISIAPEDGGTRYTDRVEIEAGLFTPFIVAFAQVFYRHRQRRWRHLIAKDFNDPHF